MYISEFLTMYAGPFFGFLGAALAAGLACVGSAKGTGLAGEADDQGPGGLFLAAERIHEAVTSLSSGWAIRGTAAPDRQSGTV